MPFNPCGVIMDYCRIGYHTKMRLWQDDPTETKVEWYRAAHGAAHFRKPTFFGSSLWRPDNPVLYQPIEPDDLGETFQAPGRYSRGRVDRRFRGLSWCGDPEAAVRGGIHGVDPEIHVADNGDCPCCDEVQELGPPYFSEKEE